jgi:succinoglycan biosynthesis protein ExoM
MLITIGICTCKRDQLLADLLAGLERIDLGALSHQAVEILVVDNSPNENTRAVCETAAARLPMRLRYVAEPERGISFARNRVVAEVLAVDSEWLACIDDDDWPEPDWLHHLLERQAETGADIVMGNTKREMPSSASPTTRALFAQRRLTNDLPLWDRYGLPQRLGTNNVLIRRSLLQRMHDAGPVFDPRFALLGGEDSDFFCRAKLSGATFARAEKSFINSRLSTERLSTRGYIRRRFRKGISQGMMTRRYLTLGNRYRWLGKAAKHLVASLLLLPLRVASRDRLARELARIAVSSGAFYGFIGRRYDYYQQ